VLTQQILERMINDLLQVQLAKETGIKVDDTTLDKTIDRIAQENNLSRSDFRAALERDGIKFPKFREDIRNEILLARLREREVENNIVVTDAEVETELAREAATRPAIRNSASPTSSCSCRRRRRARRSSSAGAARCRRSASCAWAPTSRRSRPRTPDAPDALQGGSLGWRPAARLPSLFHRGAREARARRSERHHPQPERLSTS
jgi:peptidyl-prolyl cis-trans isomerase SurA